MYSPGGSEFFWTLFSQAANIDRIVQLVILSNIFYMDRGGGSDGLRRKMRQKMHMRCTFLSTNENSFSSKGYTEVN